LEIHETDGDLESIVITCVHSQQIILKTDLSLLASERAAHGRLSKRKLDDRRRSENDIE
ncbi:hypothetical protein JTE90_025941, partial [Oedothorax gibbosus]